MNKRRNRHLMVQPRIVSRWYGFNMLKLNYSIDNSIHNLMLWYNSGKRNWFEFYLWLQNNRFEWKPIFLGRCNQVKKYIPHDIGCFLEFINTEPKYSGVETYNNNSMICDLVVASYTC